MVVFSSLKTINTTCIEYVHPYDQYCSRAALFLTFDAFLESFRIYVMAYLLALAMRRKIPSKQDIKRTIFGILQSSVFLTTNGTMFSVSMCALRWLLGSYNYLTVSFVPSFIASLIAISLERPSRRGLLCLYVTNVASETLFRMAVWRKLVTPIKYGEIFIYSVSIAQLLYFFRGDHISVDPIYGFLRFLVGGCEESGYTKPAECREDLKPKELKYSGDSMLLKGYTRFYNWVANFLINIKKMSSHPSCPHPFSCLYYILGGGGRMFALGYVFQFCLKLFLQMRRVIRKPSTISKIAFNVDTLRLGAHFASFNIIFRGISCALRRFLGKDDKKIAFPAGLVAGLSFIFFRDNTIALYFMWKMFNEFYKKLVDKGYLVDVPYSTELFYSFSTAVLFHAAILETLNLRPSYWRFLDALSGHRVALMAREPLDSFGFQSSMHLRTVLAQQRKHK